MSKLNSVQKKFLKTIESKSDRKEVKKALKQNNTEQEVFDSFKVLKKFFESFDPNK